MLQKIEAAKLAATDANRLSRLMVKAIDGGIKRPTRRDDCRFNLPIQLIRFSFIA